MPFTLCTIFNITLRVHKDHSPQSASSVPSQQWAQQAPGVSDALCLCPCLHQAVPHRPTELLPRGRHLMFWAGR